MDMAHENPRSVLLPGKPIGFEEVPSSSLEVYSCEEDITSGHNSPHYSPPGSTVQTLSFLHKDYKRLKSSRRDELRRFRMSLRWWGLDQSTKLNIVFSWFVFIMFTLGVPVLSSLFVTCPRCEAERSYAYDKLVQIPESTLAAISFFCLSRYARRYGLRQFLFLDQLCDDAVKVQQGYTQELDCFRFCGLNCMDMAHGNPRSLLLPGKPIGFEEVPSSSHEVYSCEEDITSGHNSPHYSPPSSTVQTLSFLHKDSKRLKSSRRDELRRFIMSLRGWGLDQSTKLNIVFSWFVFIMFTLGVPVLSSLFVTCPCCEAEQSYAYDKLVQIPESTLAAISFFCLSRYARRYGLRQFLFLDQLCDDTVKVQQGYTQELDSSFKLLAWILLPSFLVELLHKILWFMSATVTIPYIHGQILSNSIMFVAVLVSWLYRTGVFLFICVLFRLTCHLQILRFEVYKSFLEEYSSDVYVLLKEHMRIKHQVFLISHRFRIFILASLLTISISQLIALAMMLSSASVINFFNAGDLVVCSAVQLTGFLLCLLGAARITHRAQGLVSMATRWHSLSTCSSHGAYYSEKADLPDSTGHDPSSTTPFSGADSDNDSESSEVFFMFPSKDAVAAFQMRQSFVTYLQYNNGGITLFGFVLDRGLLYTIFAFEFSLVMWILSKAIALSSK